MQANIPDEWVNQRATINYKTYSHEDGQSWAASMVQGTITDKNDLGIIVEVTSAWPGAATTMLITYDALLTVDV